MIAVIGLGTIGCNLAEWIEKNALEVRSFDAKNTAGQHLKGRSESLNETVKHADIVFECVPESLPIKQQVLAAIEDACPASAILASTTSALLPSALGRMLRRPERLVIAHVWNPPDLVPLVELVPHPAMAPETVRSMREFLETIHKIVVVLENEIAGFVGNRLQWALLKESISLVDSGIATFHEVDEIVKRGLGARLASLGPFTVADLGGLDVFLSLSKSIERNEDAALSSPQRFLASLVEHGDLGAKTGKGFYEWSEEKVKLATEQRDILLRHLAQTSDQASDRQALANPVQAAPHSRCPEGTKPDEKRIL